MSLLDRLFYWLETQRVVVLLILRITVGAIMINHGYPKLFEQGIPEVIDRWESMGLFLAPLWGVVVPLLEFGGGLLLLLGVATRTLAVALTIQFVVIAVYVQPVLLENPLPEFEISLAVMSLLLATLGGGVLSLGKVIAPRLR